MRNVFDQYDTPENRLTHALSVTLHEDKVFARRFLRYCGIKPPERRIEITVSEQSSGRQSGQGRKRAPSIPDLAITAGDNFCVLVESKVAAAVSLDQIRRHQTSAERSGFRSPKVILLTLTGRHRIRIPGVVEQSWSSLYTLLGNEIRRPWAKRLLDYMDILEAQMVAVGYLKHDKLTTFRGIPFGRDNPYDYREAKRLLGLAMDELRGDHKLIRRLKVDRANPGRSAITGKKAPGVWDFLALKAHRKYGVHTKFPHLTLSISDSRIAAVVTVPDKVDTRVRHTLLGESYEEFEALLGDLNRRLVKLVHGMGADGAKPYFELMQRHYRSQSAHPTLDGALSFDLRTAFPALSSRKRGHRVQEQRQWLESAYEILNNKRSNIQWGVGVYIGYDECSIQRSRTVLKLISGTWFALEPLLGIAHRAGRKVKRIKRHRRRICK